MKVCNLLKVHKNQVLVVAHDSRHFLLRRVDSLDVSFNNGLEIFSELLFGLHKLPDDSPVNSQKVRILTSTNQTFPSYSRL